MDNGDIDSSEQYGNHPNGRFKAEDSEVLSRLSWQRAARGGTATIVGFSSDGSLRKFHLWRCGGGIIAPPVNVPEHKMYSMGQYQRGLAGISTDSGELTLAWKIDVRPSTASRFPRFR